MKQDAVTSSEGYDVTDIGLTKSQKELFENLKITAKPMVFLNYGGKPISLEKEIDHLDAILFCYGVGMLGNLAICDILLGKINPSGRLPFTVARNVGQLPFFYNHYLHEEIMVARKRRKAWTRLCLWSKQTIVQIWRRLKLFPIHLSRFKS